MLKLEKALRTRDVNILIRDPERRFTVPLMKAFAIAFGIHLALFLLFQITALTYRGPTTLLAPTFVIAEHSTGSVATLATTDLDTQLDKRIPIRKLPEPHVQVGAGLGHFSSLQQNRFVDSNPFDNLEEELIFPPSLSTLPTPVPPIQLVISGNIQRRLVAQPQHAMLPKLPQRAATIENTRSVFSVAVNPVDGKIFWYETVENTAIKPLDILAESLLKSLQFAPEPHQLVMKGTVEIHFNLKSSS